MARPARQLRECSELGVPPFDASVHDAAERIAEGLPRAPLLVLQHGADIDGASLGRRCGTRLPGARVIGTGGAGRLVSSAVAALAAPASARVAVRRFPSVARVTYARARAMLGSLARDLCVGRSDLQRGRFAVVCIADGGTGGEELLVAALGTAASGLDVVGAACDPRSLSLDGEPVHGGAVVALIEGASVAGFLAHAYRATERRTVATRCDAQVRLVHELDGWPAAERFAQLTGGVPGSDAPSSAWRELSHQLGWAVGGHLVLRTIAGVRGTALEVAGAVETGAVLRVMERSARPGDKVADGVQRALAAHPVPATGVWLFACPGVAGGPGADRLASVLGHSGGHMLPVDVQLFGPVHTTCAAAGLVWGAGAGEDEPVEREEELRAALAAAERTVAALSNRVEALDGRAPPEPDAMARALAGMQQELARRAATLQETEATYQALYESTPNPLLTIDATSVILACNRTGLDWLGAPRSEVVGRPLAELFDLGSRGDLERIAAAEFSWASERVLTLADGRRVLLNAASVAGTSRARYHVTLHDVTTRQLLDDAKDQRRRVAAVADLAGAVARELNDPMSIVQGRLELLLELGFDDGEMTERHLTVALEHARRISATLRNLRLLGRAAVPRLEKVFLSEALTAALELVGQRARNVVVDLEPDDLAAGGDAAMFARVLASLLRRTLDAAPAGRPVELHGRRSDHSVRVRITGGRAQVGHGAASTSERSIDQTLLASVGATLEEARMAGSLQFTLELPVPPATRIRARPVSERLLAVGRAELAKTLGGLLGREGYEVVRVAHAEAALERIERDGKVAAVATELFLEGMSGLTLAGEVGRRFPRLRDRVLLITDAAMATVPHAATALTPPLTRAQLLTALGRRVRRQ